MVTKIVKIGNSQGIRIPKPILDQTGLSGDVELQVSDNCIIIQAIQAPRKNWDDAFYKMAQNNDDQILDPNITTQTQWDEDEWEW
jgi:antitoxin MazE